MAARTSNADGTVTVQTRDGTTFTVTAEAGPTGTALARSVVDPDTGRVEITVSERAINRAVPRALAHEIAEAATLLDGRGGTVDVLSDAALPTDADGNPTTDPRSVSPHDRGRIAELRFLETQLDAQNPITRWRARRDIAGLLRHLGLVSGTPTAEPGTGPTFVNSSPDFSTRLGALDPDAQRLVSRLNTIPEVGSLPDAVAERWRYLTRGLLSGATQGVLAAGTLGIVATVTATPALLTAGVVAGVAALGNAVVSSLADHRHSRIAGELTARTMADQPLSVEARQLLDTEAAELATRVAELRALAAEATADRDRAAESGRTAPSRTAATQPPGVSGRHDPAPDTGAATSARPANGPAANDQNNRAQVPGALDVGAELRLDRDAAESARPTAGDRVSALDAVPAARSWLMKQALGPGVAVGLGAVAHAVAVGVLGLPAVPLAVVGLGVAALASPVTAAVQRSFARAQARARDAQEAVQDARSQARAQARLDANLQQARAERRALAEAESRRAALERWYQRAEQTLIHDAAHPDAPRQTDALPPRPSAPSESRAADLTARLGTLDVAAIPDSDFDPESHRRARPAVVARQAAQTLLDLGPRDGVRAVEVHSDGSITVRHEPTADGPTAASTRIRLAVVESTVLAEHSIVARAIPDPGGSFRIEISEQTTTRAISRAVLAAVSQISAVRTGAPALGANQFQPGPGRGPIDPSTLTAADHARIADLTHLLDQVDNSRGRSRAAAATEYAAALRAAGLELPTDPQADPDVAGAPRRRAVLDPDLLTRIESHDRLPAATPSMWMHQRKWVGSAAFPSAATPTMMAMAALQGLATFNPFAALSGAVSPLAIAAVSGVADWASNRSREARQDSADATRTAPSEGTLAREAALVDAVAQELIRRSEQGQAAERNLAARAARYEAARAREQRNADLSAQSRLARVLDALTHRADPTPPGVDPAGRPGTRAATTGADRAAVAEVSSTEDAAAETETATDTATDATTDTAPAKVKLRTRDLIGIVVVPAATAAGVAIGIATGVADVPVSSLFNPAVWSALNPLQLSVVGTAVTATLGALTAGALGILGERLVSHRTVDRQIAQKAAQKALQAMYFDAVRDSRLAPSRAQLELVRSAVAAQDAQVDRTEAGRAVEVAREIPVRRRGPLRALADLFGGARPAQPDGTGRDNGSVDGAGPNAPTGADSRTGSPNGGPTRTGEPSTDHVAAHRPALARALAGLGRSVTETPGGLTLTRTDSTTLRIELHSGDVTGDSPVSVARHTDTLDLTIDRGSAAAHIDRALARAAIGEVLAESAAAQQNSQQRAGLLDRGPLPSAASVDNLAVSDQQSIAELKELMHQIRTAGPGNRAGLIAHAHELLSRTGLRAGAPDAAARRALLPSWLVSDLEFDLDPAAPVDAADLRTSATNDLAALSQASGLVVSQDPAQPDRLSLGFPDGITRIVSLALGALLSGEITRAEMTGGGASITIDPRVSPDAVAISLAGSLAELAARAAGAPADGSRSLRPDTPPSGAALSAIDQRLLAELRMATSIATSGVRTPLSIRWRTAVARDLGMLGNTADAAVHRAHLDPAQERSLAGRFEPAELTLTRQYVEAAAERTGAGSIRTGLDRIQVSRGDRRIDVRISVLSTEDVTTPLQVTAEDALLITINTAEDGGLRSVRIFRTLEQMLDGVVPPAQPPPPDRPGPPTSGTPDNGGPPRPPGETDDEFWRRIRAHVNVNVGDDDDEDEYPVKRPASVPPVPDPSDPGGGRPGNTPDDRPPPSGQPPPTPQPQQPPPPPPAAEQPPPRQPTAEQPGQQPPSQQPPSGPPVHQPPTAQPPTPQPPTLHPPTGGQPTQQPPTHQPPQQDPPTDAPAADPDRDKLRFDVDGLGIRRMTGVLDWRCPDGGSIRLLLRLLIPPEPAQPVILLSALGGTAPDGALREHIAALATDVLDLVLRMVPGVDGTDPETLRWLVHEGPFTGGTERSEETLSAIELTGSPEALQLADGAPGWVDLETDQADQLSRSLGLEPVRDVLRELGRAKLPPIRLGC